MYSFYHSLTEGTPWFPTMSSKLNPTYLIKCASSGLWLRGPDTSKYIFSSLLWSAKVQAYKNSHHIQEATKTWQNNPALQLSLLYFLFNYLLERDSPKPDPEEIGLEGNFPNRAWWETGVLQMLIDSRKDSVGKQV